MTRLNYNRCQGNIVYEGTVDMVELNLSVISPEHRQDAEEFLRRRLWWEFLHFAKQKDWPQLVALNVEWLKENDCFEHVLLDAYVDPDLSGPVWPIDLLDSLFAIVDPIRIRRLGNEIAPGPDLTLYRGVCGNGKQKRIRGWSWTASLDVACWFAVQHGLENPEIYSENC